MLAVISTVEDVFPHTIRPLARKLTEDSDVNIQETHRNFWTFQITFCVLRFFSKSARVYERLELADPIKSPCGQHCEWRLSTKFEPSCSKKDQDTHVNIQKKQDLIFGPPKYVLFFELFSKLAITFEKVELAGPIKVISTLRGVFSQSLSPLAQKLTKIPM